MPLPAAILLDLDGTLVDSEAVHAESIARVLHRLGVAVTDDERAYVVGHAWQDIFARLRVAERVGLDLVGLQGAAVAEKERMFAEGLRMRVLPGAVELVETVNGLGIPLAIVSGSCRAEIAQTLGFVAIADRLRFFLGAEDYPAGKPAPDGYLLAARRLGVEPAGCLVFEDSEAGIDSGLRAGMRVVASRAGNPGPEAIGHQCQDRAHHRVDSLLGLDAAGLERFMRA